MSHTYPNANAREALRAAWRALPRPYRVDARIALAGATEELLDEVAALFREYGFRAEERPKGFAFGHARDVTMTAFVAVDHRGSLTGKFSRGGESDTFGINVTYDPAERRFYGARLGTDARGQPIYESPVDAVVLAILAAIEYPELVPQVTDPDPDEGCGAENTV